MLLKKIIFVLLLVIATAGLHGCHAIRVTADTGQARGNLTAPGASVTTTRVRLATDSLLGAAAILGLMLSNGLYSFSATPDGVRRPERGVAGNVPLPRISVQDCTQPIDLKAGNLVCR